MSEIYRELDALQTYFRRRVETLDAALQKGHQRGITKTQFAIFETYRTPLRQLQLFNSPKKVTKAPPWSSAHQYGLAVDFVPIVRVPVAGVNGYKTEFSWANEHDWTFLYDKAVQCGLFMPYFAWDKVHVQAHSAKAWEALLPRIDAQRSEQGPAASAVG